MKKEIGIVLICICIMGLCGCNGALNAEKESEGQKTELGSEEDKKASIINIVDHFQIETLAFERSEQCFYEDDKYEYCFNYEKSHMVEVTYENGTSENLKEAFENGHVTIDDLNNCGISFYQKKKFKIVDESLEKYIKCPDGKEVIFEDDNFEYYFDRVRSQYVEVTYEDGSKENIKDALASGRINVFDMSLCGIDCFVLDKNLIDTSKRDVVAIVDLGKTGCCCVATAMETFYEDEMYRYCFSNIESHLKDVYYSDGTCENIVDALEAGHITIDDLGVYDISYWAEREYNIVDQSLDKGIDYEPKQEIIYESERYIYYFDVSKSQYIEIVYRDGSTENAIDALKEHRIKLSDLCDFGIGFYIKDKNLKDASEKTLANIVNESYYCTDATEYFYEDETYTYYFHSGISHGIYAYYTDGTSENIRQALENGNIQITDLDKYRIRYGKRKK